jgi:hypothetical protein
MMISRRSLRCTAIAAIYYAMTIEGCIKNKDPADSKVFY